VLVGASLVRNETAQLISFAVLVIAVATMTSRSARRLRTLGDPSYGIYIYGYPIQQTLVWAGVGSSIALLCLSLPISLAFGYASWHLVESRFVRRGGRRTAPVTP
jgi:peptidoglycan/LPS O-acetylase OafA/YrhL